MSAKHICLLLSITLASACGGANDAADSTPVSNKPSELTLTPAQQSRILIDTVAATRFTPSISTTGTVAFNGDQSTQVLSPVSGPVIRLLVQPGTYVSRGTTLATVSSPDFAAALSAYRKAVATAKNLQRIAQQDEQLFKTDALSRRDLEQAQTDAESAVADREAALAQIKSLGIDSATAFAGGANAAAAAAGAAGAIRAPISGTVVERLITPGQLLEAGTTPAFTIADLSTVWVMANVFESDLAAVHKGERVTVTGDVSPTPFEGTVDYIGALVDPATRATAVRVLVRNRNDLLKRDMYVNVSIAGNTPREGIIIPSDAVLRDDQNLPYVYVASGTSPNTHYARRRVVLGSQLGKSYEIKSGLQVGDHIVAQGALFLQFAESL
ncbi:MAG: efflux RND transporter periplasmic adaptor subunit [Gemmatimonadaceae bacterium]